jgi:hypothetical protein
MQILTPEVFTLSVWYSILGRTRNALELNPNEDLLQINLQERLYRNADEHPISLNTEKIPSKNPRKEAVIDHTHRIG